MVPAPALPSVEYAERSDPGRDPDKQVNEDACGYAVTRFGHLCVVCDGMGGHAAGREASELALATIFEVFEHAAAGTPPGHVLKAAVEEASRRVHTMRTSEVAMGRPGSTAVAILLHAYGTEIAHVGDSRAYLVHEGQIFRVTRDHSVVQEMVDRGLLAPEQAQHHPDANRITRALGMAPEVEAELRPQPIPHLPGDAFVLCSDGLSDLVADTEILGVVGSQPAAQAVGKLVDLANARGGHDNVTVVILRAREGALAPAAVVAPTVAQTSAPSLTQLTSLTSAPDTVPNAPPAPPPPPAPTPIVRTEVLPVVAAPPQPPREAREATPEPPPSSTLVPGRRSPSAVVIVAIVLAVLGVLLLGGVLVAHLRERGGKASGTGSLGLTALDAQAPPSSATPIAPTAVVLPEAGAPAEPIAPLVPSPPPSATSRKGGHSG